MRLVLGSVLTAIAIFVWGFLFWGMNIAQPFAPVDPAAETAISETLKANLKADDAYYVPTMTMNDEKGWVEKHKAGPLAQIFYRAEGSDPMNPMTFVWGFVHMLVTALILGFALYMVSGGLATYRQRVLAVVTFGIAASIFAHLSNPVWFLEPWHYSIAGAVYDFVAYVLAGLILGWFIRPGMKLI